MWRSKNFYGGYTNRDMISIIHQLRPMKVYYMTTKIRQATRMFIFVHRWHSARALNVGIKARYVTRWHGDTVTRCILTPFTDKLHPATSHGAWVLFVLQDLAKLIESCGFPFKFNLIVPDSLLVNLQSKRLNLSIIHQSISSAIISARANPWFKSRCGQITRSNAQMVGVSESEIFRPF